ncbi:hypothetical protein PHLGIDRAFT_36139 [Phlebiopsis gigantea 11061_1 CR5-6]|uniref:F-box domain-containing protein n=1 Tax=Phlebiopsis gigantea (strain 11061_1 CR5-6) TaxID=745531 RepID=A0A0C3S9B6_PHLG1|nr:hypothetical protein PHLGIDRAFT_36139 [Phlebiopsis gigantea 11061_1 CR5-6]
MTDVTQPTGESSRTPTGSSRFPQELYDIIIALASTESLSSCSLVSRSWLYTASSRLLADFRWPTKSLTKEKKHQEDGFFRCFMKALTESPRLQGCIRSLRLGPAPGTEIGHTMGSIEISLLADIIALCPRLDHLTLSRCRPYSSVALERRQCGRIGTLAFSCCSMASPSDAEGVLHTLSLFSRVDRLRLSFYGARVSVRPTNILSTSLEIGRIETFETLAGFDPGAWELLRHICASPSVRTSIRAFATYDEFCPEVSDCLQQMSGVEEFTYCVDRFITPAFSIIPSLRRLKMFVVNPGVLRLLWSSMIRDLMLTPDQLEQVTINIFCPVLLHRPLHEEEALEKLRALLEDEDWHPLEQFLEQRTSLKSFEFEVLCIYKDHAHVAYREPWSDVDPGHAEETFRGVMDRKLSKGAAARSIITPIVRQSDSTLYRIF